MHMHSKTLSMHLNDLIICIQVTKREIGGSLKVNTSLDLAVAFHHKQNIILNSNIHTII